jgi:DNA-binding transcriptional MocR family regulator
LSDEPNRRSVVLGPAAHELRRHVGPTAWAVLEEMVERSTGDCDHLTAQVSIRALASSLGLAKDTVARAVRRLRDIELIVAEQRRTTVGSFDAGSYRPAVPEPCIAVVCIPQPVARPSAGSARRPSGQLSLLPED